MGNKKIGTLFGMKAPVGSYKTTEELVLSRARIGVEIEVDQMRGGWMQLHGILANDDRPHSEHWNVVEDPSVHDNGAELVFARPLFGQDVIDALDYFYTLQREVGFKHGLETGIHVHLDVRNMDYDEFNRLCILYGLVEPLLFKWIGDDREYNIFCEPWYRAQGDLLRISSILFDTDQKKLKSAKELQRYTALNLAALVRFGSVEFRHLPTTFDKQVLLDWINMILSLKRAAMNMKEKEYDILLRLSRDGPEPLINEIFPRTRLANALLKGEYNRMLEIGCLTVQDIVTAAAHGGNVRVQAHNEWAVGDWAAKQGGVKAKSKPHPGFIKAKAKVKPKKKEPDKLKKAQLWRRLDMTR